MATAQAFFTPTQISGCQLWLDAADVNSFVLSGTTITRWNDKSGNGRNATASGSPILRPNSINGQSSIFYDGVVSTTFSGTISITTNSIFAFAVFISNLNVGNEGMRIISFTGPGCSDWNCSTTVIPFLYDTNRIQTWRNSSTTTNLTCPAVGSTILTTTYYDGSIAYNSLFGGSSSSAISSSGSFNISNYTMTFGNVNMKGYLAEVIIFTSVLSSTQRQQVEGYLAWKWGLQSSLPANHPYKTSPIPPLLSPPVTIPKSIQTSFFLPTQISGCQIWFDAANSANVARIGNSVTSWTSRGENALVISQSANNPTYVQNAYNSLPTLRFSFSNTLPLSNAAVSSSIVQTSLSYTIFLVHLPNANNSTPFAFLTGGTSRLSVVTPEGSNISYDGISARLSYSYPSQAAYLNGALRMESFYSLSSTGFYRRDGTQLATASLGSGAYNATQNFFIGGAVPNYPGYYYGGDICEVVWFNVGLTTAQIQQVEGYLAWKWGLQANLPATHPFKTSPISPLLNPPSSLPNVSSDMWNPTRITGCTLWLDPSLQSTLTISGSTITQWRDRVANIVFTPGGSPTYTLGAQNKLNVVTFNGSSQYFSSSFTINSATHTLIAVHKPNAGSSSRRIFAFQNSGLPYIVFPYTTSKGYITSYDGSSIDYINSPLSDNSVSTNYNLIMATIQSGQQVIYLNGTSQASTFQALTSSTTPALYLGVYYNAGSPLELYGGDIGEVIIYNSFLTTAQRQNVEGYLAWKWGLVSSLPANHPFKQWPPAP
jgi:hypothetical protein